MVLVHRISSLGLVLQVNKGGCLAIDLLIFEMLFGICISDASTDVPFQANVFDRENNSPTNGLPRRGEVFIATSFACSIPFVVFGR